MNTRNIHPCAAMHKGVAFIATSFFIVMFTALQAQTKIEGEIIGMSKNDVYLAELFGDDALIVDTIRLDEFGKFKFEFDTLRSKGLYRLILNHNATLDFILGYDNLRFQTLSAKPGLSTIIFESKQNEIFYEFLDIKKENLPKVEVLEQFLQAYPEEDKAYLAVEKQLKNCFEAEQEFLSDLRKDKPESFISHYLDFVYKNTWENYISFDKILMLESISQKNWQDTMLLHSDAYAQAIIDVLMLYGKKGAAKVEQEQLFVRAVDELFKMLPSNSKVYDYAVLYLMNGFEQYEMESVILHIVKNYSSLCSANAEKIYNRSKFYSKFYNGAIIPDFILPDINDQPHRFYDECGEFTLLIFWATWCGHCQQMNNALNNFIPQLEARGIKVVSVSLDSDMDELKKYLKENEISYEVYTDLLGWESPIVDEFHLYATPTMFLINNKHQILGKPLNLNQLILMLNQ